MKYQDIATTGASPATWPERIRLLRYLLGSGGHPLGLAALAAYVGVHRKTASKWATGCATPSPLAVARLDALAASIATGDEP